MASAAGLRQTCREIGASAFPPFQRHPHQTVSPHVPRAPVCSATSLHGKTDRRSRFSRLTTNFQTGAASPPSPPEKQTQATLGLSILSIYDTTIEGLHVGSSWGEAHAAASPAPHAWTKPYMLLLPDFDGVGVSSSKRWPSIATGMELQVLRIETSFQGSFQDLVQFVADHLEVALGDAPVERPTFLLGEGFGAVVAIAAMLVCKRQYVSRVVLVNPATCLKDIPIRRISPLLARIPARVMQGAPLALVPLLGGSPLDLVGQMMASAGRQGARPDQLAASAMQVLLNAFELLQQLSRHLPPATLTARLVLLDQGLEFIEGRLGEVEARVMVLASGRDFLPSSDEAKRLSSQMPRAFAKVMPEAGHALLLEPGFDLLGVMREEGFLVEQRRFSSPVKPGAQVTFGAPGPIELPTRQEVARAGVQLTTPLRGMCSPVFLSTLADGTIVEGLAGLDITHRPLLFVGNHQLYALDMNLLVEEIYLQKGILLRGLAHPALFTSTMSRAPAKTKATADSATAPDASDAPPEASALNNAVPIPASTRLGQQPPATPAPAAPTSIAAPVRLGDVYRTFGAVIVSPTAFFRLLAAGEAVLLYPGGVREGFKRRDEKYELFWPEKGEFVRMAAKHEAWVIPVSAVGWEDSISIVMDTDEIARHPWLGAAARAASDATPRARDGSAEYDETFIPPFIAPSMPARLYFLLGQPVPLTKALANDRAAADATYKSIKNTVKDGMNWLLQQRELDPYKDLVARLMFENNPVRAKQQAPSFRLDKKEAQAQPQQQQAQQQQQQQQAQQQQQQV